MSTLRSLPIRPRHAHREASRFTPGPYHVSGSGPRVRSLKAAGGRTIAHVLFSARHEAESEATAHLLAAAPDLLLEVRTLVIGCPCGQHATALLVFALRSRLVPVRAVLRRSSPGVRRTVQFGDITIDFERRSVCRNGESIKMTPAEYNLLAFFVQNPDKPLTRDMILNSVWGYECFPNTRTVDAHVVKLRQKLETDPVSPRHFLTVHGVGYRFLT